MIYLKFWIFGILLILIPQPSQEYDDHDSYGIRNTDRERQLKQPKVQDDLNTENIRSSFDQSNTRSFSSQQQHEIHPQQETVTSITNTERQRLPVFKVQRDPTGKLGIVLNNTNGFQENGNEYDILTTNQSQRSTTRDTFITTPRPPQPSRRAQHQGDIIFPDDHSRKQSLKPQCTKPGEYYCTEVQNYPSERVEIAIQSEIEKYEQVFGEDLITPPDIADRIHVGEETLCSSSEELIYPQAGLTKDNNWNFIVNQKNYTQGIRIEKCSSPGKPCSMSDLFPNGYTTECRQHYIYRQLLSITPEGKVIKDLFKIPSCCKCVIKNG